MARPAAPPASAPELSFEGALARLEQIVAELETGDLALERALAAFEEGVALSRRCASQLEDAERRIERLVGDAEAGGRTPLGPLEDDAEGDLSERAEGDLRERAEGDLRERAEDDRREPREGGRRGSGSRPTPGD